MTDKSSFNLSRYQKAMLTHMGITPWQVKGDKEEAKELRPVTPSATKMATGESQPSQAQKQKGLEKLKQHISTPKFDAKGGVLVLFKETHAQRRIIRDLLQYLADDKTIVFVKSDQALDDFKNYSFVWQISNTIDFTDNVLQTLSPDQLTDPKVKKQLWDVLAVQR
ncbi:hypothetical protein [Aliiglaciecola sp. M165]|uniref:hypothetical protein n=1 Tax=Aliiglaciecola sp. M165 TaxID=2593649 RepID=UPI00117D5B23|nr:hypothetical protein [Aliiglaciecola sp. M165]TRY29439.1 hypothetical protein FM019_18775 [Aliiglaciecola sp. M165]